MKKSLRFLMAAAAVAACSLQASADLYIIGDVVWVPVGVPIRACK